MSRIKSGHGESEEILRAIYAEPWGITLVKGYWKTGKTNFTLKLFEDLKRLGLVHEAAGNVKIYAEADCINQIENPVKFIDNFAMLKAWMFKDSDRNYKQVSRKFFIYDEAMKNAPSKRAMTALVAEWQRVVPELSKGKVHLFALTQEESMTEKIFRHPTFNVATWEKIRLPPSHPQYRKRVKVSSKLLKETYEIDNVPETTIFYKPGQSAEWSMDPMNTEEFLENSLELKVAYAYSKDMSTDKIVSAFPEVKDRKEATRLIKKALRVLFSKWQVANTCSGNKEGEDCHETKDI